MICTSLAQPLKDLLCAYDFVLFKSVQSIRLVFFYAINQRISFVSFSLFISISCKLTNLSYFSLHKLTFIDFKSSHTFWIKNAEYKSLCILILSIIFHLWDSFFLTHSLVLWLNWLALTSNVSILFK